jgi:hypothetical protein
LVLAKAQLGASGSLALERMQKKIAAAAAATMAAVEDHRVLRLIFTT